MNVVDRYEFLNAKLRARIGIMRSSTLIADMMKAPTLVDAVGCLRETGFAPLAEIYDKTGDLQEMGVALVKGEIAAYQEVARLSDPKLAEFILSQLGRDEEDNLKNTIRLWYSGVVRMHSIRYRSAYLYKDKIVQDINWTALINATDWNGVVAAVKDTIYEPVLRSYTQDDIQQHGLFDLEIALDKAWYAEMMRSIDLLGKADREIANHLYLHDFDLKNLLRLIRFGRYYHMDAKELEKVVLPWGKLASSRECRNYIASKADERDPMPMVKRIFPQVASDVQQIMESYHDPKHTEELLAAETLRLETYLGSERAKEYGALLSKDPFTIGVILAYFYYYRKENMQIRAILNGKYYGYTAEKILEVVG
ncbi:MAG: V-type ATPase subunit [Sphaerochaetaceae bacterium]|nr:V-type ATPase subunit [Spirochaetales bacterium]MDY5500366.1 V-type ATPase subunit [Sphaerochaetaceae bacterium]